jgi:hypothetical protein
MAFRAHSTLSHALLLERQGGGYHERDRADRLHDQRRHDQLAAQPLVTVRASTSASNVPAMSAWTVCAVALPRGRDGGRRSSVVNVVRPRFAVGAAR